ncbi:MAG: hypothetical protein JW738_02625, partial [Actinobacteria bacterium]|nr:hypothetical protein [Actinomycetota bacterium]
EGERMREHLKLGPFDPAIRQPVYFQLELNNGSVEAFHAGRVVKGFSGGAVFDGMTVEEGLSISGRICARSATAHSIAYCRAIEDALGIEVDDGAGVLRVVLGELERIAAHLEVLADIARFIEDNLTYAGTVRYVRKIREAVLGATESPFGAGAVVPGGVSIVPMVDEQLLQQGMSKLLVKLLRDCRIWERKVHLLKRRYYWSELDLSFRSGELKSAPAFRASGSDYDLRYGRSAYGLYERISGKPCSSSGGLTIDRILVLLDEIKTSVTLIRKLSAGKVPEIAEPSEVKIKSCEGTGYSEGPHGGVEYHLNIDSKGKIVQCSLKTASSDIFNAMVSALPGTPYDHLIPSILSFCPCAYCLDHPNERFDL